MTRSDTFGLVTGSTWIFSSEPPVLLIKKNNRLSCITRLKIHHQLENHRKELFSTELHWEIFCGITSYDYNSRRLGHVTSPELKMGGERCKYLSEETIKKFKGMSKAARKKKCESNRLL